MNVEKKLKPTPGRVIVKFYYTSKTTKGGIVLPDTVAEKFNKDISKLSIQIIDIDFGEVKPFAKKGDFILIDSNTVRIVEKNEEYAIGIGNVYNIDSVIQIAPEEVEKYIEEKRKNLLVKEANKKLDILNVN